MKKFAIQKIAGIIEKSTDFLFKTLRLFLPEKKLKKSKPIHLCWWFEKHNLPIPQYFIGGKPVPPQVTTGSASNITTVSFDIDAEVTSPGTQNVIEWGFYLMEGTSGEPDESNTVIVTGTGDQSSGFPYSDTIIGLTLGTSYRIRAYAINSVGTGYGNTITVTTLDILALYKAQTERDIIGPPEFFSKAQTRRKYRDASNKILFYDETERHNIFEEGVTPFHPHGQQTNSNFGQFISEGRVWEFVAFPPPGLSGHRVHYRSRPVNTDEWNEYTATPLITESPERVFSSAHSMDVDKFGYIHIGARINLETNNNRIAYKRGKLNGDGSITFTSTVLLSEIDLAFNVEDGEYRFLYEEIGIKIGADYLGRPWITWQASIWVDGVGNRLTYGLTSSINDEGGWTTRSGFPIRFSMATAISTISGGIPAVIEQSEGRMSFVARTVGDMPSSISRRIWTEGASPDDAGSITSEVLDEDAGQFDYWTVCKGKNNTTFYSYANIVKRINANNTITQVASLAQNVLHLSYNNDNSLRIYFVSQDALRYIESFDNGDTWQPEKIIRFNVGDSNNIRVFASAHRPEDFYFHSIGGRYGENEDTVLFFIIEGYELTPLQQYLAQTQRDIQKLQEPTVLTSNVDDISYGSARAYGTIISSNLSNIIEYGFVYMEGISGDPTINDEKVFVEGHFVGAYDLNITELKHNTDYRIRAYAINSEGIGYGDTIQFSTLEIPSVNLEATQVEEHIQLDWFDLFEVNFNVIDEQQQPITDAVITFDGVTNDPGDYVFEQVPAGIYNYTVEKNGYEIFNGTIEVIDENIYENVTLIEEPVEPEPTETDFSEYDNDQQPAGWTKDWGTGASWLVQEDINSPGGKKLAVSGSNNSDHLLWSNIPNRAPGDIEIHVEAVVTVILTTGLPNTCIGPSLFISGHPDTNDRHGVLARIRVQNTHDFDLQISVGNNNSFSSNDYNFGNNLYGEKINIHLLVDTDRNLYFKVWAESQSAPVSYTFDRQLPTLPEGGAGVCRFVSDEAIHSYKYEEINE